MTKPKIEVRLLKDSDIESANAFYNSIHGTSRDKSKFLWEFSETPAMAGVYVVAVDEGNGKIVGSQGAIPMYVITKGGETILTAKSEDTLVHPDYRGLSIFENMYRLLFSECQARGINFIWGFTYAIKPFSKLGFDCPFQVNESLLVFSPISAAKYLSDRNRSKSTWTKIKMFLLAAGSVVYAWKRLALASPADLQYEIRQRKQIGPMSDLIQAIEGEDSQVFIVDQTDEYIRWRIVNNPYHDEIISVDCFAKGERVANVLFNHHENGAWYVTQDLYSPSVSRNERAAIMGSAVGLLKKHARSSVSMIRSWEFTHNTIGREGLEARRRAGFYYINHGAVFVWKTFEEGRLVPRNFVLSRMNSEGKI